MADFDHVYEPSDDTFLLCDALENDRFELKEASPSIALEVGSGSGCVITFLTTLLKEEGVCCQSFATDVNPYAANATRRTAEANSVRKFVHAYTEYLKRKYANLLQLVHVANCWFSLP